MNYIYINLLDIKEVKDNKITLINEEVKNVFFDEYLLHLVNDFIKNKKERSKQYDKYVHRFLDIS